MRGYPIQTRWWGIPVFCWRRHESPPFTAAVLKMSRDLLVIGRELHIQQAEASSTGVASKSSGKKLSWVSMKLQYSGSGSLTRFLCRVPTSSRPPARDQRNRGARKSHPANFGPASSIPFSGLYWQKLNRIDTFACFETKASHVTAAPEQLSHSQLTSASSRGRYA
jgi:hypothetical protein